MKYILENYEWFILFALAVLEAFLRFVPTARNFSLLDKLINLLNLFVPNRRKPLGFGKLFNEKKHYV